MTPYPWSTEDPGVILLGAMAAAEIERVQLHLVCRFYGFHLTEVRTPKDVLPIRTPLLVVVPGSTLKVASPEHRAELLAAAESYRAPIAVTGVDSDCPAAALAAFAAGTVLSVVEAGPGASLVAAAAQPDETGFELRDLPFALGEAAAFQLATPGVPELLVMAKVVAANHDGRPSMLRLGRAASRRYVLARATEPADAAPAPGSYPPDRFGAIAPIFLLLRDVGRERCWQPPGAFANLTIDDPWLTEPYGGLSFTGLLKEMRRERFHTTIGFIPWNYDRNDPKVVNLLRENPAYFSLAVHGNNHDRYEFYRYASQPNDNQRAKPLEEQVFNVRQALARLTAMEVRTGLAFDRVMVFPHGISPAKTFAALKRYGYWATFNYSNVPRGERLPGDHVRSARAINADWHGFPAVRRAYPEKYPDAAVAIDLFLGNPVLFMAHQDNFFDGIEAFTPHARRVNTRQPAVRWTSLGEISRHLYLLRWRDQRKCDVRLYAGHAQVTNPSGEPVEFHFIKTEPETNSVVRVTVGGDETNWTADDQTIRFVATAAPEASLLIEIHLRRPEDEEPITLRRSGVRNHALRLIAEFRDLYLARFAVGRLLTRHYYHSGKKRPTFAGLIRRLSALVRGRES